MSIGLLGLISRSKLIFFFLDNANRDFNVCFFETRRLSPQVTHLLVDSNEN